MEISLKINGKEINANVKPNTLLSTFIRENLNLTGTHIGCDTSQCGACAIHLNGDAVKSCAYLAVQADGAEIVTDFAATRISIARTATIPVSNKNDPKMKKS